MSERSADPADPQDWTLKALHLGGLKRSFASQTYSRAVGAADAGLVPARATTVKRR
jgi:hypothetical protein